MTGFRLFVCMDGSVAALAAGRLALELAEEYGGVVRAVSVVGEDDWEAPLPGRASLGPGAEARMGEALRATLHRFRAMGQDRSVEVETELLHGGPLREILRDARSWRPDLVLIGRTRRSGPGSPMLGSLAMQVVEFADWPVIVVPEKSGDS